MKMNMYRYMSLITNTYQTFDYFATKIGIKSRLQKISKIGAIGLSSYAIGKIIYSYGTVKTETFTVDKRFCISDSKKNNKYMVSVMSDNDYKKIFVVDISYLHFVFKDVELWAKLQEEKTYDITYYGFSIPDFGIHPKIIGVKKI